MSGGLSIAFAALPLIASEASVFGVHDLWCNRVLVLYMYSVSAPRGDARGITTKDTYVKKGIKKIQLDRFQLDPTDLVEIDQANFF